jgi:hypothetical protein
MPATEKHLVMTVAVIPAMPQIIATASTASARNRDEFRRVSTADANQMSRTIAVIRVGPTDAISIEGDGDTSRAPSM